MTEAHKFLPHRGVMGEGDHAEHGGGGGSKGAAVAAPSTALRAVPLPRYRGEGP